VLLEFVLRGAVAGTLESGNLKPKLEINASNRSGHTGTCKAWCAACGAEVGMLTAFEAARLTGVSSYTIFDWAETGDIHHFTTPTGVLLVCPRSFVSVT
jgi:hypothetical protein